MFIFFGINTYTTFSAYSSQKCIQAEKREIELWDKFKKSIPSIGLNDDVCIFLKPKKFFPNDFC
jgi:hypothetical protein